MPKLLDPNQSYTFSKIFELKSEVDLLVADFGYSLTRKRLALPQYNREIKHLEQGLNLYRVTDALDPLMGILVQALITKTA